MDVSFEQLQNAFISTAQEYERHKGDEKMQDLLMYHAQVVSDAAERAIGHEPKYAEPEGQPEKVRKKSSHEWTPEQRAAAAERLRARQAAKKAANAGETTC